MIKKLKAINPYDETEIDMDINSVAGLVYENTPLVQKINELVDAVNELQESQNTYWTDIAELKKELLTRTKIAQGFKNLQDPYAEQRRWVGKLCRFWNKTEYTDDIYGFLTDIVPTNKYKPEDNYFVPFKDEFGSFYEHCEPVKPDDDIIYKGGDNE